jgi:transcriptional accessory protein Tex/SPT6
LCEQWILTVSNSSELSSSPTFIAHLHFVVHSPTCFAHLHCSLTHLHRPPPLPLQEGLDEAADEGEDEDDAPRRKKKVVDVDAAEAKLMTQVRARYNRSELVESFCTDRDDLIRKTDRPERFQDVLVGRVVPDDRERDEEADWMAHKLSEKIIAETCAMPGLSYEEQSHARSMDNQSTLERILKGPIDAVLKFFQVERFEVPFIWTHRRDYLAPQMTRRHLWYLYAMDERWERLYTMKKRISEQLSAVYDAADDSASTAENAYQAEDRMREFRRLILEMETVQRELKHADEDLQIALNVVDTKDEEATPQDRENVEVMQDTVDAVTVRLNEVEKKLADAKEVNMQARRKRILSSKYRPDAAVEVATLFPRHKYQPMIDGATEEQEVRDLMAFLALLLKGAEAGAADKEVEGDETDREMTESVNTLKGSKANRVISMGKDEYKRYRRIPRLREFANLFAHSAYAFGEAIRYGIDSEPPVAPPVTAEDAAMEFVDGHFLKTPAAVLKAVSVMLASELCAEPSVRAAAREQYRRGATVTTRPTPKGLLAINPFSPLFGLHHLDRKELDDFYKGKDRTLFLRLLEAEKSGLITVRLDPPQEIDPSKPTQPPNPPEWRSDPKPFLLDSGAGFAKRMLPRTPMSADANPYARGTWDKLRLSILESLIDKHLMPSFEQEFRRDLVRIGKEAVVEEATENFERMLTIGPYRAPPTSGGALQAVKDVLRSCPKRPAYYTVVAVVLSQDMRQPACMAYVDAEGTLRAQKPIPDTIWKSHKESALKEFIFDHRPDVIVVNSSAGHAAVSLKQLLVTNIINNVAEMIRAQYRERRVEREERLGGFVHHRDDEEGLTNYNANVIIVKDDLSAIFKISPRAKKMFPEFEQGVSAAICLARYVQEPLAEYCSLWTSANAIEVFGYEALFLDVHPLKHLLGNVKLPLLRALEQCLVDAVCEAGVDMHLAVNHDHLSPLLAFVAGLGLRKAEALKMAIRKRMRSGSIACRNELLEKKLLGPVVWTNAASFLRIPEDRLKSTNVEWDPFEDTRIHPECYIKDDFAPKICADSLEVEHDQHKYLETVVKMMSQSRKRLLRRLQMDEPWVKMWQVDRPSVQGSGYGSGAVVPTSVWMRRPEGEYLQTRRAVNEGVEMEVRKLTPVELDDAMALLELEEYASELEKTGHGKRLLQLQAIKEELRYPYLDLRRPLEEPDERDMFTIITGEGEACYPCYLSYRSLSCVSVATHCQALLIISCYQSLLTTHHSSPLITTHHHPPSLTIHHHPPTTHPPTHPPQARTTPPSTWASRPAVSSPGSSTSMTTADASSAPTSRPTRASRGASVCSKCSTTGSTRRRTTSRTFCRWACTPRPWW